MKQTLSTLLSVIALVAMTLCLTHCASNEEELYGTISGTVTDADTHEPLKGVSITITPQGETKVTGSDGTFSFQEVIPEEQTLTYKHENYESDTKKVSVSAGTNSRADMVLVPLRPKLSVSETSLDFGAENTTLSFDITNSGKGILNWKIEEDIEWLECSVMNGKTEKEKSSVVVNISREGWTKGEYSRTMAISSNGGSATITVEMQVSGCNLSVTPKEVDLGETESNARLTITNNGNGTVKYEVMPSNEWIGIDKTQGAVTTKDYVNITVNRGILAPGEYNGQVTIKVEDEQIIIPVKLIISAKSRPVVSFDEVKSIAYNGATLAGTIVQVGNSKITRYGFCYAQHEKPSIADEFTNMGDCTAGISFTGTLTNLKADTKYYVCVYAENNEGISYSNIESFTTAGVPEKPTVQTQEVTDILSTSARAGGLISSLGNVTSITQYGHVWDTKEDPTTSLSTKTELGVKEEIGSFSSELKELLPNKKYFVRAYATNEKGTAYGETKTFTTAAKDMILTTSDVTDIAHNAATCGGAITDFGGRTVKECGICWSTTEGAVSISDRKAIGKLEESKWSCRAEGLSTESRYYIRAYAIGQDDAAFYGPIRTFITTKEITLPIWGNVSVNNIGKTKVNVQATLTSDGNSSITEMGICWSTHAEATIYDEKLVCDNGTAIAQYVTGLQGLTTYYLRVYAQNAKGIAYSNEVSFTTADSEVDIWDGTSVATSFAGGAGTESDPIRIETAAQLKLLADKTNAGTTYGGVFFKLVSNINLNNKEWTPMGTFSGNFDGGGNKIENLKIINKEDKSCGFFTIIENGKVSDLVIKGKINNTFTYYINGVGMLCGYSINSTLDKIETEGEVESLSDDCGGICGIIENCNVTNCINRSNVKGNNSTGGIVGVGWWREYNNIFNCINYGSISGNNSTSGIIASPGNNVKTTLNNCINYSDITSIANPAGIAVSKSVDYKNCYWLFDIANNIGIQNGFSDDYQGSNCSYFTRSSTSCPLFQLSNKDLVEALNEWVDDNGADSYCKWEYKTIDGYACPVMKRE